jgi:signal transduction histidine kinase
LKHHLAGGAGPILNKRIEVPAVTKGGAKIFVELAVFPINGEDPLAYGAFLHDITARREREAWERTLVKITETLLIGHDIDTVAPIILDTLCTTTNWDFGDIWLHSEDKRSIVCRHTWFKTDDPALINFNRITRDTIMHLEEGWPGLVLQSGDPVTLNSFSTDPRTVRAEAAQKANLNAALLIPLLAESKPIGILELLRREPMHPDHDLLSQLVSAGNQIAQFIQRREAERALVTAMEDATRASFLKSQLVSVVSHELRTPLTGIFGMADLLAETAATESDRSAARDILTASRALLSIVNDLLDMSKIEAGRMEVEQIPFVLADIVDQAVSTARLQAKEKSLQVNLNFDVNVPERLVSDPLRLKQVLMNLLTNAVKFTKEGEVKLTVNRDGQYVRFAVADTGIGMTIEQQQALFVPFAQATKQTPRKFGGTGLGLFISKRLVELMGGNIALNSSPGQGTTIWFSIPEGDREKVAGST